MLGGDFIIGGHNIIIVPRSSIRNTTAVSILIIRAVAIVFIQEISITKNMDHGSSITPTSSILLIVITMMMMI